MAEADEYLELLETLDQRITMTPWEAQFTIDILEEPHKIAASARVREVIEEMWNKYMR